MAGCYSSIIYPLIRKLRVGRRDGGEPSRELQILQVVFSDLLTTFKLANQ
jgi:hypothetical protein